MSKLIELHSGKPVEIIYVEEPRSIGVELLGTIISNIINDEEEEMYKGAKVDRIKEELKKYNLYKERE